MTTNTATEAAKILDTLEQELRSAKLEEAMHKKQLDVLRPRRTQIEMDCKEQFDCTLQQLPGVVTGMEAAVTALADELQSKFAAARGGQS